MQSTTTVWARRRRGRRGRSGASPALRRSASRRAAPGGADRSARPCRRRRLPPSRRRRRDEPPTRARSGSSHSARRRVPGATIESPGPSLEDRLRRERPGRSPGSRIVLLPAPSQPGNGQWHSRVSSPITVTGSRRACTAFPGVRSRGRPGANSGHTLANAPRVDKRVARWSLGPIRSRSVRSRGRACRRRRRPGRAGRPAPARSPLPRRRHWRRPRPRAPAARPASARAAAGAAPAWR